MSLLRVLRENIEAAQDRDPAARGTLEVLLAPDRDNLDRTQAIVAGLIRRPLLYREFIP